MFFSYFDISFNNIILSKHLSCCSSIYILYPYILCNTDRKWLVYYTEIISTQNNQSNLNIISFSITRKIRFTFPLGLKNCTVSFIKQALVKISIKIGKITPFNVILETSVLQFWIYNVYNSTTKKSMRPWRRNTSN